ncbi:MaoC/PaaZ C-terminal domain-containing protein [Nocardioides sp. YIM 152315]|uniref:MaoC/PaaZ C-terminal domain-containing protein n=1 Tax=Nocardioides sp. YIM 152315 TaxID=3031760 RepID=UPI0023DC0193|nr:MaoC/PaaZ C-terminal domain-containing protein [Nocardioides sp. YIM 152315]MDF1601931.1 MaoC/PaaZ C-terminal domain-containing protein [Nocardioides sp. YIM 152315]
MPDVVGIPLLLKAALPKVRPGGDLPDLRLERHDVLIDPDHVAAYADLCGFPRKDTVPLTYPHLLAFGLHLRIMADAFFPFPAIGTVHLENSFTQHRPIAPTERVQVTAHPDGLRPHAKGRVFDLVTQVHARGELVWEETSTFLRRGHGSEGAPTGPTFPEAPPTGTEWRLRSDLGRRYAAVSGDRNPIHLYPLTAKAFGFPRQIAHGMWSLARCVGALENRLPRAVTVAAAFKRPILLPGTVAFGSRRAPEAGPGAYAFSLSSPSNGAPHLAGAATPA